MFYTAKKDKMMIFHTSKKAEKSVYETFDFGVAILDFSKGVNPWFWVKIKFPFID